MLKFSKVSVRRGPLELFHEANFTIFAGEKVGLTGRNGCGKSSVLALILGEIGTDIGDFTKPAGLAIAYVAQETPGVETPAIDYVIQGDPRLHDLLTELKEAEQLQDGHRQAELHLQMDSIGGYDARARAARLMHGLGFSVNSDEQPVNHFSGGWRMRLNLAQALMCRSDLLLLDEPTNHLDLDAVIWLEEWLQSYQGTLLLISHDRDFLDDVTDHTAHIEHQGMEYFTGNYAAFEKVRAERLAQQGAAFQKQQSEVAHIQQYVERFRAKATKARQAQSRLKALARMQLIAPAHVDSPFHFEFRNPDALPNSLLALKAASAGYGDNRVIQSVNINLLAGDRVGLLGPNGAGKSTLIKLIAGQVPAMGGKRIPARDLAVGYFSQHQLEQLDGQASPLLHLQRLDPDASEQQLRNHLGGFAFHGDRTLEPVAPFSGGEKARLVLALLIWQKPNLLLLDEPTNHLDLEMRHALSMALQDYQGALVLVSHDRHMLRTVCEQLWLVDEGGVREFEQDVDAYPEWLAQRRRLQFSEQGTSKNIARDKKARKREDAEQRKRLQPLRNRLKKLETSIEKFSAEKQAIENELAESSIYADDKRLREVLDRQAINAKALDAAEEEWLTVQGEIESIN